MRGFKQYNNAFRSPRQRFKSATWCHYSLRIANHVTTNKNDPASSFLVQAYGSLLFLLLSISLTTKLKQSRMERSLLNAHYTVLFTLELLSNVYLTQMEKSHVTFLSHYCARKFFTLKHALAHF